MLRIRCNLWIAIVALSLLCSASEASAPGANAMTIVFSRSISGTSCGNGFLIGDGTIVVTARHVIFPLELGGLHQGEAFVTLLSPYLGDACEADVLAQDRELDLIVLRARWKA